MLRNFKTSTQISIKFTLFTILQVLFFSIIANIVFFQNRYSKEESRLVMWPPPAMMEKMILGRNRNMDTEKFDIDSDESELLTSSRFIKSISRIDDFYFLYKIVGNKIIVSNVTPHVTIQKNFILVSIYLIILFGLIAYFLSLIFVKSSLKKLNDVLNFMDKINIDNLNQQIDIYWHPKDEINRLSQKFNQTIAKIHNQTLSLKDFVANASHELKTPLMAISTEIDYAKKSQNHSVGLDNIKVQIQNINNLLETLVTITRLESKQVLETKKIDISKLTEDICGTIKKLYGYKWINLSMKIEKWIEKNVNKEWWGVIVKNLLNNAFKFTNANWKILITLDRNRLEIQDNGIWISKGDLEHIRERFWQVDRSKTDTKSFGLWLFLTKLLIDKHGWRIVIESEEKKWTTVKINF